MSNIAATPNNKRYGLPGEVSAGINVGMTGNSLDAIGSSLRGKGPAQPDTDLRDQVAYKIYCYSIKNNSSLEESIETFINSKEGQEIFNEENGKLEYLLKSIGKENLKNYFIQYINGKSGIYKTKLKNTIKKDEER